MTSGLTVLNASNASGPLAASPITMMSGSELRMAFNNFLVAGESSTTKTRVCSGIPISLFPGFLDKSADCSKKVLLIELALDKIGIGTGLNATLYLFPASHRSDQDNRNAAQD